MRVLLVGSRQRPTGTLADWLHERGHEVRRVNRSALTKRGLHEFRPNFVVLSSTVGTHVAQVCQLLRRAGTQAPIIAAGLASNSIAAEELLDAGADEVVESPLDRSRFDTRIAALERRVRAAGPDRLSGAHLDPASLRSLLEAFPDRIFAKDLQSRFTWANRATLDLFGMHDLDELVGKTDLDVHDPEFARPIARRDRRLLKTGEARVNEEGTFVAAGERVWVLGTRVPVFDADGRVTGLVGMTRDITELKRAQLQMEESAARLRGLIEHSPDLVALVRDGDLVFVNGPGAAMLGASGPDALVGRALLDFVSDEHQAVLGAWLSAAQADGEASERLEAMARRIDGSTFTADVSVVPTVLDGDPAVQVVARDVSEASAARAALRLADEKWRSLVTNAPDTISMIDRDGRFLFSNRTMSGMAPEDVVGLTIFDVSSPDKHAEARALLHRVFEVGESGAIEAEMTGTDGAVRWWSTRFAPIRQDDAVVAAVMISTDITERRAAEEELRRREGHYRTLASHIPESIVILFDADLCVTMAEGEMLHRRGRAKEDIEGRSLADVVPAQVRDRAIDASRRAVHGHATRYKIELQEHAFEVQALPVRNSTGEIFAGILLVQDISPRTSAEAAMHKATAEFEGVFRCMPNPAVVTTADGTINVVNPSFAALFGYGSADVVGQSTRVLYADARDFAPLSELVRSDQPIASNEHGEVWFRRRDGTLFFGESAATILVDAQGSLFGYVMILHDVTEQKRTEAMIHARATQQAEVARLGQRALAGEDPAKLMNAAVQSVARTLGVDLCDLLRHQPERDRMLLVAGVGWGESSLGATAIPAGPGTYAGYALQRTEPVMVSEVEAETRFEIPAALRDQGIVSSVSVIVQGTDGPHGMMGAHTTQPRSFDDDDVNFMQSVANVVAAAIERKEAEAIISHMAFHDPLTGLPNRILFNDRFRMALEHARRNHETLGILFVDLDAFKLVNDSLGHAFGDRVLPEVAKRLQACLRATDTIARVGGDEFVILLPELKSAAHAKPTADRVVAAMRRSIKVDDCEIVVGASVGISTFPEDGADSELLLKAADRRMYQAKERGGRNVEAPAAASASPVQVAWPAGGAYAAAPAPAAQPPGHSSGACTAGRHPATRPAAVPQSACATSRLAPPRPVIAGAGCVSTPDDYRRCSTRCGLAGYSKANA